jgi:hypothetical protein
MLAKEAALEILWYWKILTNLLRLEKISRAKQKVQISNPKMVYKTC